VEFGLGLITDSSDGSGSSDNSDNQKKIQIAVWISVSISLDFVYCVLPYCPGPNTGMHAYSRALLFFLRGASKFPR
jgi:hypothetical protein